MKIIPTEDGERLQLADRERQVIRLAALGRANKAIAGELDIAESTVKRHLNLFSEAMGFESRVHITLWVMCHPEALHGIAVSREPRVPPFLDQAA